MTGTLIGTSLGPYRIDAELGSGGMGRVYAAVVDGRAAGLAPGTRVALKVVHPHLLESPGFFKRFLREAEIGKAVVHANVVRTLDCDQVVVEGRPQSFLVMELVEGQTLRALLDELGRVPEELCRHVGREVAKGLAAIHAAGIVHRDVKPDNVLITKDHAVKVMDLGVARLADEAVRLSQSGVFVGSIHYAAPECFAEGGRHAGHRADLHALGVVLYELACGANPYLAHDVPRVLERILRQEPRRLGEVNPQLSPFFEEVVHTLLAKQPSERFDDADALRLVLEQGEDGAWWTSRARAIRAETKRPLRRIRIPRETAVYGRDAELATLRTLYDAVKAGDGRVVLIEGEAGIGKSRLVDELAGRLQRDGEDVNFLHGSYPPGGPATASGAFSTAFREQLGADGSAAYLTQAPVLVPAFDALLGGETTPAGVEPLTKGSLQTCFVHVLRNLAAERTTVLLVDDLHFAPEDALSLFTALAMAVPGHRILLVGTSRPGIDEKWLAGVTRLPQVGRIALPRLGPKDLALLLADSFQSEHLAHELGVRIALKSDGNPFFAFEIIRGLREGRFIAQRGDGTWVTTRVIDEIQIPSSVLGLVSARVADLTADEHDLLDVAACLGFEFDPLLVGDVLGNPQVPLIRAFGRIERRHRLVRACGRRYEFDHHQVQEALYGAMSELLREPYHAALASALERRANAAATDPASLDGALCVNLCEHFLKGAEGGRASRYLASALTHLEKGYVNSQAAELGERALGVPGLLAGAERARTLLRLCGNAGPLDRLGRRARQEEAAREAQQIAESLGDADLAGEAAMALGWCLHQTSRDGAPSYRRALEIARTRGDRKAEAAAESSLGHVAYRHGGPAAARTHYERALAIERAIGYRKGESAMIGSLGNTLLAEGRFEEARVHYEQALAIDREIGNRQGEAASIGNLGVVFVCQGRLSKAREHDERYLAVSREIGNREHEAIALLSLGNVLAEQDEFAASRESHLAARRLGEEVGHRHLAAVAYLALGRVPAEPGTEDAAREWLTTARDDLTALGAAGTATLARCRLSCLPGGDREDAESAFAAHRQRLGPAELREAHWLLWRAGGDRAHLAEAKRLLDEAVATVPGDVRATMLANVRVHREIADAAKAAGL